MAQSLAGFTTEVLIPYWPEPLNQPPNSPFTEKIRINVKVVTPSGSKTWHPAIDTGTCGYVVSKDNFPGACPPGSPAGWEYLSSSKILYSGHWCIADVYFIDADVEVKARFPILVVDDKSVCPGYDEDVDPSICPTPISTIHNPTGISLFGVGFGRQFDGQPQGDPDKNPFLNVVSINGVALDTITTFRNGYIISKDGINIGLTGTNTAGVSFANLLPGVHHSTLFPGNLDWAPVPACIKVNDMTSCVTGTALIDTGISHSYLTLPVNSPVHCHNDTSPSSGGDIKALDNGSVMEIDIASTPPYAVNDIFVVGSTTEIATGVVPDMVITTLTDSRAPYVNTGRYFLRGWKVAYDAVGGRLGFEAVQNHGLKGRRNRGDRIGLERLKIREEL